MTAPTTPGLYIQRRRIAAGKSLDDVVIGLDTLPPINAMSRAEWLATIEDGTAPMPINLALALHDRIRFDWNVLLALVSIEAGRDREAPAICRVCACSERDACETKEGGCSWAEPDLCSVCAPIVANVDAVMAELS